MPGTLGLADALAARRPRLPAVLAGGKRSGALRNLATKADLGDAHAHLRALGAVADSCFAAPASPRLLPPRPGVRLLPLLSTATSRLRAGGEPKTCP